MVMASSQQSPVLPKGTGVPRTASGRPQLVGHVADQLMAHGFSLLQAGRHDVTESL